MKFSNLQKATIALTVANLIWGGGPPIFKWTFQEIPIFTFAFLRYAIPVIILLFCFQKYITIKKKDIPLFILAGVTGITLNIGLYFIGIQYTASINAAIISCAGPAFLILASMLMLHERPSRKMLLGNLIGLTGILLIVLQPLTHMNSHTSLFGNTLLVFSTLAAVMNTIFSKELILKYHPITLMFWVFLVGAVTFYPMVVVESIKYGFLSHVSFQGWFGIFYGSILASFVAWLLFFFSIEFVSASDTSIFSYMQPLTAIVVAAPLLHEYPNFFFIAGSILVFIGMYIAENHKKHPHVHHLLRK